MAICGESRFGKQMGLLWTSSLKLPILILVVRAHPVGHIIAPVVHNVLHFSWSGVMVRQAFLAEAGRRSDVSALVRDNTSLPRVA